MNVITLSLWETFRWGLIYFDQFTLTRVKRFIRALHAEEFCMFFFHLMTFFQLILTKILSGTPLAYQTVLIQIGTI